MRYKPKSVPALRIALGGLPEKMRVEPEPGTHLSASFASWTHGRTTWSSAYRSSTMLQPALKSARLMLKDASRQSHRNSV